MFDTFCCVRLLVGYNGIADPFGSLLFLILVNFEWVAAALVVANDPDEHDLTHKYRGRLASTGRGTHVVACRGASNRVIKGATLVPGNTQYALAA